MNEERAAAFPRFPELQTARLTLREVTLADAAWYLEHFSRPEVVRGQGFPAPADLAVATEELAWYFVDLFAERGGFRWGITLRDSRDLIGSIGFYKWAGDQAEVGYDLDPAWWGKGIMSEALAAALDFAFGPMQLQRVEAFVLVTNERSARVLERAGFAREALLPEHGHDEHGSPRDELVYVRGPDNVARLQAAVLGDPSLEQRLRTIDDWDAFVTEALAIAAKLGIALTAAELEAERRRAQIAWLARWA
jgi:[ribosomal protein S5]-alanine N-acetyltransferase